jgi:CRP/FNR family transcriptional regulator, cyclic AMP receptor protein
MTIGEQDELPIERVGRSFDGLGGNASGLAGLVEETRDARHLSTRAHLDRASGPGNDGRAVLAQGLARVGQTVRRVVDGTDQLLMAVFNSGSHADPELQAQRHRLDSAAMTTHSDMLAEVPFFALLDDQERATLAERLDLVTAPAGKVLYNAGDPGDSLYVVRSGEVELSFKNDTGDKIVLETARAGDFFGETSLMDGGPRTASAVVTVDLEALVVDRGDLDEFFRLRPAAALDLLAASGRRLREITTLLRHTASRNINDAAVDNRTTVMKTADWISEFSGSLPFLFIHCGIFLVWVALNVAPLKSTWMGDWDPFPFGLLTMVVSLEAIILSVFVLLSQNRQAARERVRNDVEYEVNLKAELEIAHMHEKVDSMHAQILARLANIEGATKPAHPGVVEGSAGHAGLPSSSLPGGPEFGHTP